MDVALLELGNALLTEKLERQRAAGLLEDPLSWWQDSVASAENGNLHQRQQAPRFREREDSKDLGVEPGHNDGTCSRLGPHRLRFWQSMLGVMTH
jgi:hypothetical protein